MVKLRVHPANWAWHARCGVTFTNVTVFVHGLGWDNGVRIFTHTHQMEPTTGRD
jgi:hypothetical protein